MGRGQQPHDEASAPQYQRPRYEQLRVEGIRGRLLLELSSESDVMLSGYEVTAEGERISPRGADQRLRIIDKTLVRERTPQRMNLHYGELEPVPSAAADD